MIYNFIIHLLVLDTVVVRVVALNVKTVLFTQADLAKKDWSLRDVALLKARMYFQDLIPPMDVSQRPEYVKSLLRYVRDCYASVNRETFDSETESVLTDALSDVIGGYLKTVALPVTKSVYYSGGLPTRDALQMFKYYKDIKNHLHTHGEGWADEVTSIVKTENVRDVRSDLSMLRIKQPCQRLLYQQKNQQNLSMPMPSIDWNTHAMFIPLSDQPIVYLRSPHIADVLQRFHHVATACERSSVSDKQNFQDSFETWVKDEIVPHLSDDDLYTAFKGILSLIDSPKLTPTPGKMEKLFIKSFTMSTNTVIIISILILELICCIPTLLYILKKRRNSLKVSSTSFPSSSCSPSCTCNLQREKRSYSKTVYRQSSNSSPNQSQEKVESAEDFTYKKYSGMLDKANSDLSSVSGTRRSYSSVVTDVPTVIEEVLPTKYSKRDKKIQPSRLQLFHYQQTETDKISVTQEHTQVSTRSLLPKATSTCTAINIEAPSIHPVQSNPSNDTVEGISQPKVDKDKRTSKQLKKSKRFRIRPASPIKTASNSPLSYSQCTLPLNQIQDLENRRISQMANELKLEIYDDRLWDKALIREKNEKKVEFASHVSQADMKSMKLGEVRGDQPSKTSMSKRESIRVMRVFDEKKTQRLEDSDQSVLEKRIERPKQTHHQFIRQEAKDTEGMLKQSKGILKVAEENQVIRKTSKIPKRINLSNAPCNSFVSPATPRVLHLCPHRRSLIPTPKRAFDDSAISSSSPRETKFNITL